MNNERDDLAKLLMYHPWLESHEGLYAGHCPECPGRRIYGGYNSPNHADHLADAILTAGYSTRRRTVTTEAELDALPVGSVVLDPIGISLHRNPFTGWCASNGAKEVEGEFLLEALPATVLYSPEVTA